MNANNLKRKAALLSVFSNALLVIGKISIGLLIGSVGVLSEGIHSSIDLLASIIAFFAIKHAAIPPDEKHRYGHGKIENVSGVIEGLLIFAAGCWIIYESIDKLINPTVVDSLGIGIMIMGVSTIVNIVISRYLKKVATETNSIALKADAAHLQTDVLTSFGVGIGLLLVYITGYQWLDPIVAILVAFIIIYTSFEITVESFAPLLDSSIDKHTEKIIHDSIDFHKEYFIAYHSLRTRLSGSTTYVDFKLIFCKYSTIDYAADISMKIKNHLKLDNSVDIFIQHEACNNLCIGCSTLCKKPILNGVNHDNNSTS